MLIDRKEARRRAKSWVKELGEEWSELSRKERKALVNQASRVYVYRRIADEIVEHRVVPVHRLRTTHTMDTGHVKFDYEHVRALTFIDTLTAIGGSE